MSVPEASVNEHDGSVLWEHHVWLAWQTGPAQAEPEAPRVQCTAYQHLQLGVGTPYPRHLRGALFRSEAVRQNQPFFFFVAAGSEA